MAITAGVLLLAMAGCVSPGRRQPVVVATPTPLPIEPAKRASFWNGQVNGAPSIVIDLSDQRAYSYKDGTTVGESKISDWAERLETPIGTYKVIQENKDHASSS